jgi:phosphate-selective porin
VALVGVLCVSATVAADEGEAKAGYAGGFNFESADGAHRLKISNRVQVRFTETDPEDGDSQGAFRIRRYKFKMDGRVFEDWKFELQANFASGSVAGLNQDLLEDAWLQYTRQRWVQPWLGQGKSWFGRQLLTSSGKLQFIDRSIAAVRFSGNRQIGVGVVGHNERKTFEYDAGLYNGEGINRTGNPGGDYLAVGRVVFAPFGEFSLAESAHDYPDSSKLAIGAAVYDNTFAPIEETTLVVVTDPDTGLPTGEVDEVEVEAVPETDVRRYGLELSYKLHGFSAFAEYFDESRDPRGDSSVDATGYHAQAGYLFPNRRAEAAVRFSEVDSDGLVEDLTETRVAFSWYFQEHDYKLQADYGRLDSDAAADFDEFRAQAQFAF